MCWLHVVGILCLAICLNGNKIRLLHNFNPSLRFLRISLLTSLNVITKKGHDSVLKDYSRLLNELVAGGGDHQPLEVATAAFEAGGYDPIVELDSDGLKI